MTPQRSLRSTASPGLPILIVGDLMLDRYLDGPVERISPRPPSQCSMSAGPSNAGGAGNVAGNVAAMGEAAPGWRRRP